jgi:hypothetical protein
MRIRSEQVRQMQVAREASFCERICGELREETPEQTARFSDEALSGTVSEAIEKAKSYGIASGDGVRRFVKLAVLIDPRFDELPDVQRFLKMPDLDPDLKIKLLSERTAQELRARIS